MPAEDNRKLPLEAHVFYPVQIKRQILLSYDLYRWHYGSRPLLWVLGAIWLKLKGLTDAQHPNRRNR
jgi:hypothetical protein